MLAFKDEMSKIALPIPWGAITRGAGSVLPYTALLGAGIGGYKGYRKAKERGEEGLQAALSAGGGALTGGAIGAGAGALGGAALGMAAPKFTARAAKAMSKGPLGSLSRFGQRQVHGFTGGLTPKELMKARGGAYGALKERRGLQLAIQKAKSPEDIAKARKALESFEKRKWTPAALEAQERGLTSIPGYLKGIREDVRKGRGLFSREGAIRTGAREQWRSMGPWGKAFMYGMPAALAAHEIAKPGPASAESIGGEIGGALGFVAAPIPMVGQFAAASAGSAIGTGIGKAIDWARGVQSPTGEVAAPEEAGYYAGGQEAGGGYY